MQSLSTQINSDFSKRRYLQLQSKERYLEIINNFAFRLMHFNTTEEVVWGIAKQVIARMGFEDCVIYLLDKEKNLLIQKAAHGPKNPKQLDIKNPITIPIGMGIVGTVAEQGMAEIVNDTRRDSRYILDDNKRLSEISVPIIHESDVIGVIDSEHSEANFYTEEHLSILNTIAAMTAIKIKHAQAAEQLRSYQKNLEEEVNLKTENLQIAIDKLKRSNQDLESFAYAASHDLQEPLRTIISYIQLIQRNEDSISPDISEYFNYAVSGAKRMKFLLQGLLAYSRINNLEQKEIVSLNTMNLIFLIEADLNSALTNHQAQITYQDLHPIKGNKTQITQLFQNILSNALKFKREGVNPVIIISSSQTKDYIEFQIADNGIGIDSNFHQKIFGLFSRLNPIGVYEGSGIGLAMCRRIMEYHEGEIAITSKLGAGTTFHLKFPIR